MTINVSLTKLYSNPDGPAFPLLLQPSYNLFSPDILPSLDNLDNILQAYLPPPNQITLLCYPHLQTNQVTSFLPNFRIIPHLSSFLYHHYDSTSPLPSLFLATQLGYSLYSYCIVNNPTD